MDSYLKQFQNNVKNHIFIFAPPLRTFLQMPIPLPSLTMYHSLPETATFTSQEVD